MRFKYPDQIGYINNKKGFASVTTDNKTVAYILCTRDTDTGKQLIIKTYTGTNGTLLQSQTFVPQIPYRFILNDVNFFNGIKHYLCPYSDIISLYNPGIHAAGNSIIMPDAFNLGSTKFIEINLPRSCMRAMTGKYKYEQIDSRTNVDAFVKNIEAYDLESSMVVESIDSTQDNLIITVASRVDIDANLTGSYTFDHIYYTIPITILIKINRNSLVTDQLKIVDITPFSWTYPINYNFLYNSIGQITEDDISSFENNMWNYSVIPGKYSTSKDGKSIFKYVPESFGCLSDTAYDGVSGYVTITSMGNYTPSQKRFKQVHTIINGTLNISGYNFPDLININYKTDNLTSKNSIVIKDGYYVTTQDTYNNLIRSSNLIILDSGMGIVAQILSGNNIYHTDLVEKNNLLFLTFCNENKQYVFKFPEITTGLTSQIGKDKILTGEGFKNTLLVLGFTLVYINDVPTQASTALLYDLKDSAGNNIRYYLDDTKQDKSISPSLVSKFVGEDYNLRLIGDTCLVIDKMNIYSTGQINSFQYLKV